jgi:hypothetical protein
MFSTVELPHQLPETAAPGMPAFSLQATRGTSSTPVDSHVEEGKYLQIQLFFIHRRAVLPIERASGW